MKNTILGIVFVFQMCSPIFVFYAFQLYDCLYFFDPQSSSWYYRDNTCRRILITLEYMVFAIVHSSSVLVDILVTARLYKQIKV
ncbi:hypothetical protein Y032_0110g176 [Ancylostoma ceylanicum]|nr:hypothetical protein Y032_0110g176 [Ancylostoma ceylanicum]